ncbi:MAG: glycosyltransferase [Alphaproteobacteria bacterium]|nr:glycosyltransferase [Alphaproteobacteria bacterium]
MTGGRPKALLILGMHRAGTSAITRLVNLLGADLGNDLLPPAEDNLSGFWENREIVAFHHRALRAAVSDWDDFRAIDPAWFESDPAKALADELAEMIGTLFKASPIFAMKDPRACRLVPLWRSALAETGHAPAVILPWRPVGDVAASLTTRNGFGAAQSGLLWHRHISDVERETRDLPRSIVSFDAVLDDWRGVADRLSADLDLEWPVSTDETAADAERFFRPGERHHHGKALDDTRTAAALAPVERALNDGDWTALRGAAETAGKDLSEAADLMGPVLARQITERWTAAERLETTKRILSETSDQAIAERDKAQTGFEEVTRDYQAASAQLEEALQGLAAYQADNARLESAVAKLQQENRTFQDGIAELRQDYDSEASLRAARDEELGHRQEALDHIRSEYDAAIAQRDRLEEVTTALSDRIAEMDAELGHRQDAVVHYREQYDAAIAQRDALTIERDKLVTETDRRIEHFQSEYERVVAARDALERTRQGLAEECGHLKAELADAQALHLRVERHLIDTRQVLFSMQGDLAKTARERDILAVQKRQIQNTLSWQLTKPWRVVTRGLLRALRPVGRIFRNRTYPMELIPLTGVRREDGGFRMIGHEARFRLAATTLTQPNGWCWVRLADGDGNREGDGEGDGDGDGRLAASLFIPPTGPRQPTGYHPLLWAPARTVVRLPDPYIELDLLLNGPNRRLEGLDMEVREVGKLQLLAVAAVRRRRQVGGGQTLREVIAAAMGGRLGAWAVQQLGERSEDTPRLDYHGWIQSFDSPAPEEIAALRDRDPIPVAIAVPRTASPGLMADIEGQAGVTPHRIEGSDPTAWSEAMTAVGANVLIHIHPEARLRPFSLLKLANAMVPDGVRIAYADHDRLTEEGRRTAPDFKPEFDRESFIATGYTGPLHALSRQALEETKAASLDGLVLEVERIHGPEAIRHIPAILAHLPMTAAPIAPATDRLPALRKALPKSQGKLTETGTGRLRLIRPVPARQPSVSLIIPTRDKADLLKVCVDSIWEKTDYRNFEIVVVDNNSEEQTTKDLFAAYSERDGITVLPYPHPFNYSAINNFAARRSKGKIIGLVNNDVEAIDAGWLGEMVSQANRRDVGAVGALLLYGDDTVQHAGVACGPRGVAAHICVGRSEADLAAAPRDLVLRQQSAVTAACLLTRRQVWEEVGGLDTVNLPVAFNDVDYCLKVREAGYKVLWTPHARLHHYESKSRGRDDHDPQKAARFEREVAHMRERWAAELDNDPFYNPNLTIADADGSLAFPPRCDRAWMMEG